MAGPAGVGKRLTAVAAAQAINCLQPQSSSEFERDACGECASCRRIARGVHPDVIIVEPGDTGSIKIEQLRDVIDRSQYRPFEGRRRIVIIDEADAATAEAQSALLKTLEEPPSASTFVLVSSLPDALLPTVRSRCPRLRFGPLTPADVAQRVDARSRLFRGRRPGCGGGCGWEHRPCAGSAVGGPDGGTGGGAAPAPGDRAIQ